MYKLIILLGICSASCVQSSESFVDKINEKIVGCYFDSMGTIYRHPLRNFGISNIDASLCTHVLYSYIGDLNQDRIKDSDFDLDSEHNGLKKFQEFQKQNPSIKTLISVIESRHGPSNFPKAASNSTLRRNLVNNIVNLVVKTGFDGFDLDWEFPNDKKNFVMLLAELRQQFDKHGLILCVSVGASEETAKKSYDIEGISKYAHIINLITYDFLSSYGNDPKIVIHNSPLYPAANDSTQYKTLNVANAVKYWIAGGASPEKILIEIAMFGTSYTLSDPKKIGRGAPLTADSEKIFPIRELGYTDLCNLMKREKWQVLYDKEQEVPYAFKGNVLFAYDNVESVTRKAEFINKMNLGGTMAWSIDNDDFNGECGEKYPLLKTLNWVLRNKK